MIHFFSQNGLLFRLSIKENYTCRHFLCGLRKCLGIFDINILIYNLKKISKILTTFLSKNFRIQLVLNDFLTNKFRYFWKDNNFFAKFFQLINFTKIRITLLRNFQVHLNYFTKKNRFYNYLRKTFFQKKIQIREKFYTNAVTKTVADLLVLINPPYEIYSHQAILRQIPTILITNSSHNLNNDNYSLAINVHTETKLFILITFIKKFIQFFFFTTNIKKLFWKFFFFKFKNKYTFLEKKLKKPLLFFIFSKNQKSKIKTYLKVFSPQILIKKQILKKKKQQFINVTKNYLKIYKKNYLRFHLFLYKQRQARQNNNALLRRKNFNVDYKKQLQKQIKPSFLKLEKQQQKRFLLTVLKKMPKLKIFIGKSKKNI